MARQTRAQRRARREAAQQGGSVAQRERTRPQVRPAAEAPTPEALRRAPGSGFMRFVRESWAELQKVEWPNQTQVVTGTTVVLIACVIVGIYLWVNDLIWQRIVQHVFLGQ